VKSYVPDIADFKQFPEVSIKVLATTDVAAPEIFTLRMQHAVCSAIAVLADFLPYAVDQATCVAMPLNFGLIGKR